VDQKNLTAAFQDPPCAGRTCLQERRVFGKQFGQPGAGATMPPTPMPNWLHN